MNSVLRQLLTGSLVLAIRFTNVSFGQEFDPVVHSPTGQASIAMPAEIEAEKAGTLKLRILDRQTTEPTFCRVNVIGSDGRFYEPASHKLKPYSLSRLGNREGKGPFRYYGWFFYCDGQEEILVPPGDTTVEVWKGFEFRPRRLKCHVERGEVAELSVVMEREADMASRGWYSGDTHVHLSRTTEEENELALDLAAAEDLRFMHVLCMNDPRRYSPTMDQQIWHQKSLGPTSFRQRGIYAIMSGQEYRCQTYGHICLIGHRHLVQGDGPLSDPDEWPVFGQVADETHSLGGYAFHAHGGYEKEIYADFALQATDGVELLQFAVYRGIGLEGWYHILSAGYEFPAIGGSDYPYCRALGDCRTYACLGETPTPTFGVWNKAIAEGRSFFTTGPLLDLKVEGRRPGDHFERSLDSAGVAVRISVQSLVSDVDQVELIVNGRVARSWSVDRPAGQVDETFEAEIEIAKSAWIAARAFARDTEGRENTEAHTNPVYVTVPGTSRISAESLTWLIEKLDQQIAEQVKRSFGQRAEVLAYFEAARRRLVALLESAE